MNKVIFSVGDDGRINVIFCVCDEPSFLGAVEFEHSEFADPAMRDKIYSSTLVPDFIADRNGEVSGGWRIADEYVDFGKSRQKAAAALEELLIEVQEHNG
jgi:3-isopropylmalate dehydratase small subunit